MEEINVQPNNTLSIIIVVTAITILALVGIDRLLKKVFNLEHPKHVDGYIKNKYVSRPHQIGVFLLQTIIAILGVYMGFQDYLHVGLFNLFVALLFVALTFEAFMQWKYPIQRNEYKKTICDLFILLVTVPILYTLIPADWFVK